MLQLVNVPPREGFQGIPRGGDCGDLHPQVLRYVGAR